MMPMQGMPGMPGMEQPQLGPMGQALTGAPPMEPEGQDPLIGLLMQLLSDPNTRAQAEAILASMPPAGGMEGGMPGMGGLPMAGGMGGGMPGGMPY